MKNRTMGHRMVSPKQTSMQLYTGVIWYGTLSTAFLRCELSTGHRVECLSNNLE